jgi:NAD(P)-dependent dehydrogenase (short-subunit alcohol dehydrogenase family)
MRLVGKRAIITGGASGIGRATAHAFAAEGAAVLIADRDAAVHETTAQVCELGGRAAAVTIDVTVEHAGDELVAACVRELGGLDIMFANAGITGDLAPFTQLTSEGFRKVLEVNLLGVFQCVKSAAMHMLEAGGGVILCTASVAGLRAGAGPVAYSASKAGVINLVQNVAAQLRGSGIRVNAICPGLVETAMTQPMFDMARAAGKEDRIGQLNPLGRAASAEEIAQVAVFLASEQSSYVNGQALVVDGGLSASLPFVPGKFW